jgi:signal transduction histidine kinase
MHRTKFTVARAPCVSLPKHLGSISKRPARFASSHNMAPIEAMRDVGEEERELLISTRNESDGVSVEVRDSGPGFTPVVLDRVFEAFYTTKPSGLGLGLSICRSIIEAHNGRLWASANLPRGASFQFALPAIANTAS